jgi:hypothetical protein
VPVVEPDAEHPAAVGLDDLTLDLELLVVVLNGALLGSG